MFFVCFVCFLSFVAAAQAFSSYQSDSMLLEAGFLVLFFAPRGLQPGWGAASLPSRASLFLLQWEWFRIYFESGLVKLLSGDPEWRNFTAMDEYYQNGPLPTWIGWYVAASAALVSRRHRAGTLGSNSAWSGCCSTAPRAHRLLLHRDRRGRFGVILTANYTFLNYLVLLLGFLLLDDRFIAKFLPDGWKRKLFPEATVTPAPASPPVEPADEATPPAPEYIPARAPNPFAALKLALASVMLLWIFYTTTVQLVWMFLPHLPLPTSPVAALEPFRIANRYGLFAVMTRGRYEIEFQGSDDGQTWIAYPFRYKPQALNQAPRVYAPYQPRFDWNLWFASLGSWRENMIVPSTEERLLVSSPDVLALFAGNPFPQAPPKLVRAVLWQYWFTTMAEKRATGMWWRRKLLGLYAPVLEIGPDGKVVAVEIPEPLPPHP